MSDSVSQMLSSARSTLAKANKDFPSPKPAAAPANPAAPKATTHGEDLAKELAVKKANVDQYTKATYGAVK